MHVGHEQFRTVLKNTLKEAASAAEYEVRQVDRLIDAGRFADAHAKLLELGCKPSDVMGWACDWHDSTQKDAAS